MGTASIQVHLTNPGQVFACLGFLEAADALCGPAEGGFMWDLAGVQVTPVAPANWTPPQKDKKQLWDERREELIADPFHTLCPMGGSFNFDARLAWTALDAGFSPDEQDQKVVGSPVVELFAAWGLEHARPRQVEDRDYSYAVWCDRLPPVLARVALAGALPVVASRRFRMTLGLSGKNKVIQFAQEEF